jgi:hypothetical protein
MGDGMTDDKKPEGVAMSIFAVAFAVPLVLYMVFASAFACAKIWAWHAVPAGLPELTEPAFIAAILVVGLIRPGRLYDKKHDPPLSQHLAYLLGPWIALLVGWILI